MVHFADPLKQLARATHGLTLHQTDGPEKETPLKNPFLPVPGDTPREILQNLGVALRERFPGIWVEAPFFRHYSPLTKTVVIPDVRFPDEAEAILNAGGTLVDIRRPSVPVGEHLSEHALDAFAHLFDIIIDNTGTVQDLQDLAKPVLEWVPLSSRVLHLGPGMRGAVRRP